MSDGNYIIFNKPGDLARSDGCGWIDTVVLSKQVNVRPALREEGDLAESKFKLPTHAMLIQHPDSGNWFKLVDMWLKNDDPYFEPYFKFQANTPGFIAAGVVLRGKEERWEIVFNPEGKCGACKATCNSCAKK